LVAHLAAANNFNVSHLDDLQNWQYVEKAEIIYISVKLFSLLVFYSFYKHMFAFDFEKGFFFTVSPDTIQRVSKFALENNRTVSLNLSAPFISEFFTEKLQQALPYTDIIFGNDDVYKFFSESYIR
jgi:adenosine kinase